MAHDNERQLIEAAQKDPERFAELYQENFHRVYAYVARRVLNRDEAQDLTSEVFHRALANLGRFEWRGAPFVAWLFRIAANVITDHSARASREQNLRDPDNIEEPHLEEVENRAHLYRCVDKLPADQRRVLVMRFTEQMSIREIAERMQRSEGAVKQLQFRALQNLRSQIGEANG